MPCKLAISSMSLGRCFAGHTLSHRLDMTQKYGYEGIELFYEDLVDLAEHPPCESLTTTPFTDAQVTAAHNIHGMCKLRGLEIISLQPFMNYEGLVDRNEHQRSLKKLALWFELVQALQTDLIQIPSNFLPAEQVVDDLDLVVADLRLVADLGLQQSPPVRFAFESLCWGTRIDVWEQCWEVVRRVDRPNFGMCLDTFNIAGRVYADPESVTGLIAGDNNGGADGAVTQTLARLATEVNVTKLFCVQIADAERLLEPLVDGHVFYNPSQPARMSWSRNCRLFYGEVDRGAYLPIREIARAIFRDLGFDGWVSMELFNRRMADTETEVPEELAWRGAVSWSKLARDMGWELNMFSPSGVVPEYVY